MSGSIVSTYSADQVVFVFGGAPASGFGPDTFITITPVADVSTMRVGADGEVARSKGTNKCYTIDLTLLQTAAYNDVLSGFMEADDITGGSILPVFVRDLRGRSLFVASQAWISRRPPMTWGAESGDRTWQITTGKPSVVFVGGNS